MEVLALNGDSRTGHGHGGPGRGNVSPGPGPLDEIKKRGEVHHYQPLMDANSWVHCDDVTLIRGEAIGYCREIGFGSRHETYTLRLSGILNILFNEQFVLY